MVRSVLISPEVPSSYLNRPVRNPHGYKPPVFRSSPAAGTTQRLLRAWNAGGIRFLCRNAPGRAPFRILGRECEMPLGRVNRNRASPARTGYEQRSMDDGLGCSRFLLDAQL